MEECVLGANGWLNTFLAQKLRIRLETKIRRRISMIFCDYYFLEANSIVVSCFNSLEWSFWSFHWVPLGAITGSGGASITVWGGPPWTREMGAVPISLMKSFLNPLFREHCINFYAQCQKHESREATRWKNKRHPSRKYKTRIECAEQLNAYPETKWKE